MANCPICCGELYNMDEELICQGECGASFSTVYQGYYEEGCNERIEKGHEKQEWINKYRKDEK